MPASITKQIIDKVTATLKAAAPDGVTVEKGRKAPVDEQDCPKVQVYWHHEQPSPIGNPRKPILLSRSLVLEVKITVAGDDEFDTQRQWVVATLWMAGNLGGLVKNLSEAETVPYIEDSSVNDSITAGAIRYAVEYTTLPGDLTAGN